MNNKVSVIITAYNIEKYIERSVRSAMNQTFKDTEIIVVDDGSIDKTSEIIEQLKMTDDRIVAIHKPNGGVSSARNAGLKIASGEFIYNLDGDDWIEAECLEKLTTYAEEQQLDIVITDFYMDFGSKMDHIKHDLYTNKVLDSKRYLMELFDGYSFPCVWNKLFRRMLFQGVEFPDGISLGEDLAVTYQVSLAAKRIGKYEGAFLHYFQNYESITRTGLSKKIYQLFSVFDTIDDSIKKNLLLQEIHVKFSTYKLEHIINFITSEPYWDDTNYQAAFEKTLKLMKTSRTIPQNISIIKKIILKGLQILPRRSMLKSVINVIQFCKRVKNRFIHV